MSEDPLIKKRFKLHDDSITEASELVTELDELKSMVKSAKEGFLHICY
jgi:hypothetical protein